MRRTQRTLVGILYLFLAATALGWDRPATAQQSITVAYCTDCVPFHFTDDAGQPAGLIIDLWREWSRKTGIKLNFVAAGWDETLRMVGEGRADAHAGLFFNETRAKFLEYGVSLTETDTHYFVDKELPSVSSIEDLAKHDVGVLSGDFVEGYLKERIPAANVIGFETYEAIIAALQEGKIRTFAADTPTGIFHLQKNGLGRAYVFPEDRPLYRNNWHVASRKGNKPLIEVINAGMAQITATERGEIERRWISIGSSGIDLKIVGYIGGAVGFVLLIILLWNRRLQRAVAEGRKLEQAQHAILEAISAPMIVVRADNAEIRYVNDSAAKGRSIESMIGRRADDIYADPSDRQTIVRIMEENGSVDSYEVRLKSSDDKVIWALLSSRNIAFEGHPAFLTTWTDITERKHAEAELERNEKLLTAFIDNAKSAISVKDGEGRYLRVNRALAEQHGMEREDIVGKTVFDLFDQQTAAEFDLQDREVIETGAAIETEVQVRFDDGLLHDFIRHKFAVVADDGTVIGIGSINTEITERKQAEAEVARGREILEITLENTDQGISMYNLDNRLVVFNSRFAEMRGFSIEFLETEPTISDMARQRVEGGYYADQEGSIEEKVEELIKNNLDPLLEQGEPTVYEQKQGDGRIHEVRSMPLEDGGIVRVMTDITDRKRAEAEIALSREILETTINSVEQGIVMIDGDHRVVANNQRYAELVWLDPEYLATKPLWADLMRKVHDGGWFGEDVDIDKMIASQGEIRSTALAPALHQHDRSDGAKIEFWSKALPDGGWVQSVTDITERKLAEDQLRQAKEAAEEATRMKGRFLANMSHELRTPLTSIQGSLSLITSGAAGQVEGDVATLIEVADESVGSLVNVINDILDFEKIQAGQLVYEFEPLNLRKVVEQAIKANGPYGAQFGVTFKLHDSDTDHGAVSGDANRLIQVLNNLLSNAAKYSPEKDEVEVSVAQENDAVRVSVSDNGPGIPEEFRKNMFGEFYQVYAKGADRPGGTGLGLSIAKSIVEDHGGTIGYTSDVGIGTTFYFELPIHSTAPGATSGSTANAEGSRA